MLKLSQSKGKICVFITTYNRPGKCEALLKSIAKEEDTLGHTIDVYVIDDCSTLKYSSVESFVKDRSRWRYYRCDKNHGKSKYWELINDIMFMLNGKELAGRSYDYYYMIQDDITICDNFFDRSISLWNSISNPKKISLLLLKDSRSMGKNGIWTGQRIRRHEKVSQIQFLDCPAFLCTSRLFQVLKWTLSPIFPERWTRNPHISSGVGEQISHRLNDAGLAMFVSNRSLVRHCHDRSTMNPGDRIKNPLSELDYIDDGPITASIASIPSREMALSKVINRLSPQVDHINVYLNGYKHIPKFLLSPNITVAKSQDNGDIGDRGKFHWAHLVKGFHFTCDDDILYPINYVNMMISKLKEHKLRAVVGCHSAMLKKSIASYYRSRTVIHFSGALGKDKLVHVLGTGTMAYHTDTIKVNPGDFKCNNMADLWFATLGQKQKIPFVSVKRPIGWLTPIKGTDQESIYNHSTRVSGGDKDTGNRQTSVAQSLIPWRIFKT